MQDTLQIEGIAPLIEPAELTTWPPAPGWFFLAGLLLLLLLFGIIRWIRQYRQNRYRREALEHLTRIAGEAENGPGQQHVQVINRLLKHTALQAYPREKVASLSGTEWMEFLQESLGKSNIGESTSEILTISLYRRGAGIDPARWQELIQFCEYWIRKHR